MLLSIQVVDGAPERMQRGAIVIDFERQQPARADIDAQGIAILAPLFQVLRQKATTMPGIDAIKTDKMSSPSVPPLKKGIHPPHTTLGSDHETVMKRHSTCAGLFYHAACRLASSGSGGRSRHTCGITPIWPWEMTGARRFARSVFDIHRYPLRRRRRWRAMSGLGLFAPHQEDSP